MQFIRGDDGKVVVDHWDNEAQFTETLLDGADPAIITIAGDDILIVTANGMAEYEITDRHDGIVTARLKTSALK
jgi:selenophosphate synthetase-related protein